MNKYLQLGNAGNLITARFGNGAAFKDASKIVELSDLLTESETEEFVALAAKSDWQGRPELMNVCTEVAKLAGYEGLMTTASVKDEFSWATVSLYENASNILGRWELPGLKKVISLGKIIKKGRRNYDAHDAIEACSFFFEYSGDEGENLGKVFLETKVNGFIEGVERRGYCRGCTRKYFGDNKETYFANNC